MKLNYIQTYPYLSSIQPRSSNPRPETLRCHTAEIQLRRLLVTRWQIRFLSSVQLWMDASGKMTLALWELENAWKWMKMDMKPLSIYDKYWFNYCRSLENWWITYLLRMVIFHDSPHLSQFTSWYLFFEEWFSIGIDPWLISKPKKPSNLTHQLKGHHDPPPNG